MKNILINLIEKGIVDSYLNEEDRLKIIEKIKKIKDNFLYKSVFHGLHHSEKVFLFAYIIGKYNNLSNVDLEILTDAAIYHDIGRIDETEDSFHESNLPRFEKLLKILKDADALDRTRFMKTSLAALNEKYLRSDFSKQLVQLANTINEEYRIKMSEIHFNQFKDENNGEPKITCYHGIGFNFFNLYSILTNGLLSNYAKLKKGICSKRNFYGANNELWICVTTKNGEATDKFIKNFISLELIVPKTQKGEKKKSVSLSNGLPFDNGYYDDEEFVFYEIPTENIIKINIDPKLLNADIRNLNYLSGSANLDSLTSTVNDYVSNLRKLDFFPNMNKIIELLDGVDVLVVANKRDLLPPNVDDEELKEYVAHRLRVAKFKVIDTVITSTNNDGYNLEKMFELITKYSDGRDVYFVGASTSGKSALISEFLKQYLNNTSKMIVTYTFDNTHLRGIRIPITNKTYIYETPGTSIDNSLLSKVERSAFNAIVPKKAVVAKKVNLTKDTCLLFGSVACIELLSKEKTQAYVYVSDKVEVKVHKSIVGDNSKYIANIFQKGNLKPSSEKLKSIKDFDVYEFQITEDGGRDIGILGLGWINFEGNEQSFRVYVPKGVYVYTTRSKIKNAF